MRCHAAHGEEREEDVFSEADQDLWNSLRSFIFTHNLAHLIRRKASKWVEELKGDCNSVVVFSNRIGVALVY